MEKFMKIHKSLFIKKKKNFVQLFESIIKKLEPSTMDDQYFLADKGYDNDE